MTSKPAAILSPLQEDENVKDEVVVLSLLSH